jgi:NTP pyrophosphatase (non-canonical NTP hydrolase)
MGVSRENNRNMRNLQKRVKDFVSRNGLEYPPEHRVLDVASELGEVSKEILKMTDYGQKPLEYRPEIKTELGDLLYSVITLADFLDVDLEEALEEVMEEYEKRIKGGTPGSENE